VREEKGGRKMTLSKMEIILLHDFLEHQYISYEKPELIELVRRLGRVYNELVNESSRAT
jgi:hypothetical protein